LATINGQVRWCCILHLLSECGIYRDSHCLSVVKC